MAECRGIDLSWVQDNLAVGGYFPSSSVLQLAKAGVRHVVDTRDSSTDEGHVLLAHGIDFVHVPVSDASNMVLPSIARAVQWAAPRLTRGDKVLLHCEHGMGRSVLLGLCLLVRLGAQPTEALLQMKHARPSASPSPRQLECFIAWTVQEAKRAPSWDDLARIAYSSALSIPQDGFARAQA